VRKLKKISHRSIGSLAFPISRHFTVRYRCVVGRLGNSVLFRSLSLERLRGDLRSAQGRGPKLSDVCLALRQYMFDKYCDSVRHKGPVYAQHTWTLRPRGPITVNSGRLDAGARDPGEFGITPEIVNADPRSVLSLKRLGRVQDTWLVKIRDRRRSLVAKRRTCYVRKTLLIFNAKSLHFSRKKSALRPSREFP